MTMRPGNESARAVRRVRETHRFVARGCGVTSGEWCVSLRSTPLRCDRRQGVSSLREAPSRGQGGACRGCGAL